MPVPAIHPGEHLAEELAALGISPLELAQRAGLSVEDVTQILEGATQSRAKSRDVWLNFSAQVPNSG